MLVALLLAYEAISDAESQGELTVSLTLLMGTVGKREVERAFKISNSYSSW
jgi:hypothetical protein